MDYGQWIMELYLPLAGWKLDPHFDLLLGPWTYLMSRFQEFPSRVKGT
jgi:hypothetical protein